MCYRSHWNRNSFGLPMDTLVIQRATLLKPFNVLVECFLTVRVHLRPVAKLKLEAINFKPRKLSMVSLGLLHRESQWWQGSTPFAPRLSRVNPGCEGTRRVGKMGRPNWTRLTGTANDFEGVPTIKVLSSFSTENISNMSLTLLNLVHSPIF